MTKVFVIKKEIDTMEKEARAQTERLMAEEDSKDLFGGINLSALDALNSIPDFDTSKPTSDGFDFDDLLDSLPNFS